MSYRISSCLIAASFAIAPLIGCSGDGAASNTEVSPAVADASDSAEAEQSRDSSDENSTEPTNPSSEIDYSEFFSETSKSEPTSASLAGLKFELAPYTDEEDGVIRAKGTRKEYTNGEVRKHGQHTYYYSDGKKQSSGDFEDDKKSGVWTFWHPNGQKSKQGKYVAGFAEDKWTAWYANGKILSEGNYEHSNRVGEWTTYDTEGKPTTQDYSQRN